MKLISLNNDINLILGTWTQSKVWRPVYDNASGEGAAGAGAGAGDGAGDGGAGAGDGGAGAGGDGNQGSNKTFTQADVDRIVQDRVKREKEEKTRLLSDLEQFKKSKGLSDEEKTRLASQIETLQKSMMTKEELAIQERKKLDIEWKARYEEKEKSEKTWMTRYTESTINRNLTDAAVSAEAYRPNQIVAILKPMTSLVEQLDASNAPTGELLPIVKFPTKDQKGNPIVMDLNVEAAIKLMKEDTDNYGNLFKSGVTAGLGGTGSQAGRGGKLDPAKMSTAEYIKARKEGKLS